MYVKDKRKYGAPNGSKIVFWKGRSSLEIEIPLVERDTSLEIEILLVESEILFRNRDTSMEIEDTYLEIEMLLVGILSLVAGYFTFVAGSFCRVVVLLQFALLQPCRIILNENEANFTYSDKKLRPQLHLLLHFWSFSFTTLTSFNWVESSHNRLNIFILLVFVAT